MNIREVARLAGVSTATVSRVLNGNSRVNPEIQERVIQVIQESNYVPNAIARSMSHGKSSIIGLVMPDISNPFFPSIARGIEDAANTMGYKVILCNTDNHVETQESYLRMLREQRVDGIILVSDLPVEQVAKAVQNVPVVWCDRVPEDGTFRSVVTDHQQGVSLAVNHLINFGHRELGMIAGPELASSQKRTLLFQEALQKAGLAYRKERVIPGDYQYQSGYDAMRRLLRLGQVTAVFCANDMMALGAIEAVFDAGLSVPDDVSIVGYDNIPFSNWSRPALTTVSQPTYLLGITALEMLVDMLRGTGPEQNTVYLQPSLILRKSTKKVLT